MKEADNYKEIKYFIEYYLPTLIKTLDIYIIIENNKLKTEEIKIFNEKIMIFLSELETAFNNQLNGLFKNEFFDLSVEMDVIKTTLQTEGLLSDFYNTEDNP